MTAAELMRRINDAGGAVWMTADRQLHAKHVPRHLIPELQRLKADVIRHIEGDNYRRLVKTFNLKRVSPEGLKEVSNGQPWQIASTSYRRVFYRGARYRWQEPERGN